jgi:hypothetical protein
MRDYHAEFAIQHFTAHPKMLRKYQVVALLHRLWICASDMWAPAPRVSIAASRLTDIIPHRTHLSSAIKLLVSIGAVTATKCGGRSGMLYELHKPEHLALSADARAQIEAMHPTDYRCKPRVAQHEVEVESFDDVVVSLDKRRAARNTAKAKKEIAETKKAEAAHMHEWMSAQTFERSDVARVLCKLIGKKDGNLRYSGKGSGAVIATIRWMMDEQVTWDEFTRVASRIFKSPDKPNRLEFIFEGSTEERREYVATMLDAVRTKLRAQPVARAVGGGLTEADLEAGRAELADLTEEQRRYADPTNIYGTY